MSTVAEVSWSVEGRRWDLAQLFESASIGFAFCDVKGRVLASNIALNKMLVISGATASSRSISDLLLASNASEAERLLQDLVARHCDSFEMDSLPDSSGRRLRWTVWHAFAKDEGCERILALVTLISAANIQGQRETGRLETIGRMAAGLAHDFNNLMTGVLLYCDLLLASLEPGQRARKHAEEIHQAGLQATGLIRQLLALAKPVGGQSRLLSLNETVEGMKGLLERLSGERIDFRIHLDPDLGLVKIDPTQAQQIVLNLVLNARDAMPNGGSIRLRTEACQVQPLKRVQRDPSTPNALPCVLFSIEDDGVGMDAETRARAFDPFFTTKGSAGTGLGLATVRQIVTSTGGLIHIDSEPGRGTRIAVLLPAQHQETNLRINGDSDFAAPFSE